MSDQAREETIKGLEHNFGVGLSPETKEGLREAFKAHVGAGVGRAPGGVSVGAALPPDFWGKIAALGGPVVQYVLQVLLAQIPLAALAGDAGNMGAALPAGFWLHREGVWERAFGRDSAVFGERAGADDSRRRRQGCCAAPG